MGKVLGVYHGFQRAAASGQRGVDASRPSECKKEYQEPEINHFGNFWILAKGKNQNKSDKHPAEFFSDVSDNEIRRAIIDREMLDYRRFSTFLKDRSEKMVETIKKRLDFSDADFGEPG